MDYTLCVPAGIFNLAASVGNVVPNMFGAANEGIDFLDENVPSLCTPTGSVRSTIDGAFFVISVMAPEIAAWQQASAIAAQLRNAEAAGNVVNATERAVLKNGFYEVNGFKFSEYYYNKLWNTGRGGSSLVAREVLENATQVAPDAVKAGFNRYVFGNWEMVYNPVTKEVWHIQPIK